jgi:peptidoglycan/xylan/chitin deacetylase (PgdA/CDA1 family)
MLNFRNTNIALVSLLILLVWLDKLYNVSVWYYLAVFFIYSLVIFWGCYNVGSNFFIKIICKAATTKKEIAISFDDGPAESYTPEILALLERNNIKAAFFCIGNRVEKNEPLVKQVYEHGHIIGNHSYSHHPMFDLFSTGKMCKDLNMMDQATVKAIGVKPKIFRPPYGVTNPIVRKAIINGNYIPVGWSVRSLDTIIKDKEKLFRRIADITPGDIVLFHDTSKTTLDILQTFIEHVHKSGFTFVRLDKLLNIEPYA